MVEPGRYEAVHRSQLGPKVGMQYVPNGPATTGVMHVAAGSSSIPQYAYAMVSWPMSPLTCDAHAVRPFFVQVADTDQLATNTVDQHTPRNTKEFVGRNVQKNATTKRRKVGKVHGRPEAEWVVMQQNAPDPGYAEQQPQDGDELAATRQVRAYQMNGGAVDAATAYRAYRVDEATAAAAGLHGALRSVPSWAQPVAANGGQYGRERIERTNSMPNLSSFRQHNGDRRDGDYTRHYQQQYPPQIWAGGEGNTTGDMAAMPPPLPSTGWGKPHQGIDRPYTLDSSTGVPNGAAVQPPSSSSIKKGSAKSTVRTHRESNKVSPIALDESAENLAVEGGGENVVHRNDATAALHGDLQRTEFMTTGFTPTGMVPGFSPTASELARSDFFANSISPTHSLYSLPSFSFDQGNEEGARAAMSSNNAFSFVQTASSRNLRPDGGKAGYPQGYGGEQAFAADNANVPEVAAPASFDHHASVDQGRALEQQQEQLYMQQPLYYAQQANGSRGAYQGPTTRVMQQQQHMLPMRLSPKQRNKDRRPPRRTDSKSDAALEAAEAANAHDLASMSRADHAHVTFAPGLSQPPSNAVSYYSRQRPFSRVNSEDETSLLPRSFSLSSDDWARIEDSSEVVNTLANFSRTSSVHGDHYDTVPHPQEAHANALDRHVMDGLFEAQHSFEAHPHQQFSFGHRETS